MTPKEHYRVTVVKHGNAIHAALAATTERVRAFIQRRKMRLDLYPLDFTHQLIADAEQFEREAVDAALAAAQNENALGAELNLAGELTTVGQSSVSMASGSCIGAAHFHDDRCYATGAGDTEALICKWRQEGGMFSRREAADELAALAAAPQEPCVCHVEDGLVQEWVSKAREVAKSKGFTCSRPPLDYACLCGEEDGMAVYSVECPNEFHANRARQTAALAAAPQLDFLISVNAALHAVQSPWRIDRHPTGQAIAVPTPEIYSSLAAALAPQPEKAP